MKKKYLFIFTFIFLASCSSATKKHFKVTSNIEKAEIFVGVDLKSPASIGKTPFEFDESIVASKASKHKSGTPFFIQVKAKGYKTESLLVQGFTGAQTVMDVQLTESEPFENSEKLDNVIKELFESYRLVRTSKFSEALEGLKKLEKDHSHISSIYEMKGSIYYLQKDYKKAKDSFAMAYKYNPKNTEALRMKYYLEKITGSKSGSSTSSESSTTSNKGKDK